MQCASVGIITLFAKFLASLWPNSEVGHETLSNARSKATTENSRTNKYTLINIDL